MPHGLPKPKHKITDLTHWFPYARERLIKGNKPLVDRQLEFFEITLNDLANPNISPPIISRHYVAIMKTNLFKEILREALTRKDKMGITSASRGGWDFDDVFHALRTFFAENKLKSTFQIFSQLHKDPVARERLITLISKGVTQHSDKRSQYSISKVVDLAKSLGQHPLIIDYGTGKGTYTSELSNALKESSIDAELVATDINVSENAKQLLARHGVELIEHSLIESNLLENRKADIVRVGYVFRYVYNELGAKFLGNLMKDVKVGGYIVFEDQYGTFFVYRKIDEEHVEVVDQTNPIDYLK